MNPIVVQLLQVGQIALACYVNRNSGNNTLPPGLPGGPPLDIMAGDQSSNGSSPSSPAAPSGNPFDHSRGNSIRGYLNTKSIGAAIAIVCSYKLLFRGTFVPNKAGCTVISTATNPHFVDGVINLSFHCGWLGVITGAFILISYLIQSHKQQSLLMNELSRLSEGQHRLLSARSERTANHNVPAKSGKGGSKSQ